MFGHVFQKQTLPAAYRQLDWIQTDGAAYLNIGFTGPNSGTGAVGMQLNAILPAAASCRPGTLFGFDGGIGLKLTATSSPLYVPDAGLVAGTNTHLSGGEETFTLYVTRDKYGKPTAFRLVWDDFAETKAYTPRSAVLEFYFDDNHDASIHFTHDGTKYVGTVDYIVLGDWDATYYSTYTVAFPAQTATGGVEWSGHKMIAWSGNIAPESSDNTTICAAMLNGATHPLAYLWMWWLSLPGVAEAVIRLDSTAYWFEDELPETFAHTPGDTYVFANRRSSGAADDFCRDLKIRSAQVLDVTWTQGQSGGEYATTVARSLVAAMRLSDGAVGLYDQTLDLFFANAAPSGAFLYQETTT